MHSRSRGASSRPAARPGLSAALFRLGLPQGPLFFLRALVLRGARLAQRATIGPGACAGVGCAGILFWRHYRLERHYVSILCAGTLLIFSTYLLTQFLRELFDPRLAALNPDGDWRVVLHTALVLHPPVFGAKVKS